MVKKLIGTAMISALVVVSAVAAQDLILQDKSDPEAKMTPPARQALGMELYVYETRVAGDPAEMAIHLPAHLEYQIELERRGIMFGAGPLFEEESASGPPVAGMIIVRADSMEAARAIADNDPMHLAGVRTYTMRKWHLNEGSVNVTLRYSDQDFDLE